MVISVCPKCKQKGTQHIHRVDKKHQYLEFYHKTGSGRKVCYIGRIRTTEEAMGEFEKKSDEEELHEALKEISKNIRSLIKGYSPKTAVRMEVISKKLMEILDKYGY